MNREKIKRNFVELVRNIQPDVLVDFLLSKGALTREDAARIFEDRSDNKHVNRLLLFHIAKNDTVYDQFVKGLEQLGLKHLLTSGNCPGSRTTKVFHEPNTCDEEEVPVLFSNLNINNNMEIPDVGKTRISPPDKRRSSTLLPDNELPLVINVKMAEKFKTTNCDIAYDTTSSKRGQVLIINNELFEPKRRDRRGSLVDLKSVKELFEQMFMKVEFHENLNVKQMKQVVTNFTKFDDEKISDMCVVVIMSHGEERNGELVVLDKDNNSLKASWIEEQFNNVNCTLFSGKPKVILYQFCRGNQNDYATTKTKDNGNKYRENLRTTEPDRNQHIYTNEVETDSGVIHQIERPLEDILVGYPTLKGRTAHRDPTTGSWYINLICQVFMEMAHNTSIIHMLNEVDRRLKLLASPDYCVQTASYTSKGFNKVLYFNPGIYLDADGNIKKFV